MRTSFVESIIFKLGVPIRLLQVKIAHYHTKVTANPKAGKELRTGSTIYNVQLPIHRFLWYRLTMIDLDVVRHRFLNPFVWLGILFALLYTCAAPGGISELFSDSLEFQLSVPTFGIAHPTGYPLYTLLGGVWSRVIFPFGSWAWRMNELSALLGAATVSMIGILAHRLTASLPGSLLAALCFALIPVWWQQATIAEVYTLHLLCVATILWVCVELGVGELRIGKSRWHPWQLFFLLGLALTHHRTTVLLFPAVVLYLWWVARWIFRPQKAWVWWGIAFLLPLLLYLYIPVRSAMGAVDLNGSYVNSWSGFWRHVLATGYAGFLSGDVGSKGRTITQWIELLSVEMAWWKWLIALLGALGLMIAPRNTIARYTIDRRPWFLVLLTLLTNLLFAINYQVADVEVFLLPVFLCIALFLAVGVQWITLLISQKVVVQGIVGTALALLLVATVDWPSYFLRDYGGTIHKYAIALAQTPFPPDSRVIGLEGEITALKYMQQAEGLGLAAMPVVANLDEARNAAVVEAMSVGAPTYLTRELHGIETEYSFSGEGVLVRVWPRGRSQPAPPQNTIDVSLADGALKLIGYDLSRYEQFDPTEWHIALYWQPQQQLDRVFKVSIRWLDQSGSLLPYSEHEPGTDLFPLRQVAPSTSWLVGETVRDTYIISPPSQLTLTQHTLPQTLLVIIYHVEDGAEMGRWQVELPR